MENSLGLLPNASDILFPEEPSPSIIHQTFWTIALIIDCLVFLLGITGNGLVIWVTGFRMTRTVTTVLFLNLASADFAFTAILPFVIISTILQSHWPFGCVFLLTLISLDRCVSVLWPVWARNHCTPARAAMAAVGAWIFALAISFPIVIFQTTDTEDGKTFCYSDLDPWNEAGADEALYDALAESRLWSLVLSRFFLGFVIPLVIISVCYALIAARLCSGMKMVKSSRPFKVLTAVVAAFFLCWLPHHVMSMITVSVYQQPHLEHLLPSLSPLSSSLVFLNSCLNPLLYVFIGRDFRERLLRTLPAALERAFSEESGPKGITGSSQLYN
uniref:G-protein coupled receptors family 1 profile domain-containing protein n=1 Tax=Monodelphis domestica TaxID=13616 RepID=A0A5F8G3A9_MONDO